MADLRARPPPRRRLAAPSTITLGDHMTMQTAIWVLCAASSIGLIALGNDVMRVVGIVMLVTSVAALATGRRDRREVR